MDIEAIRTVLKVAECSSFNKASILLFRTQSQISRTVKAVEDETNTQIFTRTTKGLHVTEQGEVILQYCKQIDSLYSAMCSRFADSTLCQDCVGSLNFYTGVNIYSSSGDIISYFAESHPQIQVNHKLVSVSEMIPHIQSDPVGIGTFSQITIDNEPYYSIPDDLEVIELFQLPLVVLCSVTSKWAGERKMTTEKMRMLPLIEYSPHEKDESFTRIVLKSMGIKNPRFSFSTNDLRTFYKILEHGNAAYVGVGHASNLVPTNLISIPIKENVTVSYNILRTKERSAIIDTFSSFIVNWYKQLY